MINIEEFENKIYELALENAVSFKGKANPKALVGKAMQNFPPMKENMGICMQSINKIVEEVNSKNLEEQEKNLLEINPDFFDKKKEKKEPAKKDGLPILENCENGVIVRFPPAPSGHLHLGHLFGIVANYEFKKKFGGKFILRFEDTNPDNIDISNYEKVIEDVKWICDGDIDEICYQSDRMDIYYKYLRTLFELNQCYICDCESETFKAYTDSKEKCPHAKMSFEEQKKLFEDFMLGNSEGVLRARADIENKNPALRTFPLARINTNNHARAGTKYKVWPNYNMACAIDDALMNLTHVIRGKDLEIGEFRQKMIHNSLGLNSPIYFHYGRMKFEDVDLSKSKLTSLIEQGVYSGWDDPRVPSILSYRKRGYKAEAFRKFILSLGISKRDSKITSDEYHKGLDYFNKQILEEEAHRHFFIEKDYKKIEIKNLQEFKEKEILLPKHPTNKSLGNRHFKLENEYIINSKDFNNIDRGDLFRLMHFANFKVLNKNEDKLEVEIISINYDKELGLKSNIHFLGSDKVKAKIIMPNNSILNGFVEDLKNPKDNMAIQFERFGFVKYEKNENEEFIFYFTHK